MNKTKLDKNICKSTPIIMMGALGLWDNSGASIHMREVVLGLKVHGIEPWVVCLKSDKGDKSLPQIKESWIYVVKKRFLLQASLNFFGTIRVIQVARKSGARIIYTRLDPGVFSGLFAAILTKSKLVVELNGLPTVDLKLYRPSNKFLILFSRIWEFLHYKYSDIIVGAPGYSGYVMSHFGIPKKKIHIVPLGVNISVFKPYNRTEALSELQIEDNPTVVWVGSVSGWQGLESLLNVAVKLQRAVPKCQIRIVGDGPELTRLSQLVNDLQLKQVVTFVGRVSYEQVPLEIAAATVCVCTFPGNRGDKFSISGLKTLNYLSCARPVVTTKMDEMAPAIEESGAGIAVEPDNIDEMVYALTTVLLESQSKWEYRCSKAKSMIDESRSWDGVSKKIAIKLRTLL